MQKLENLWILYSVGAHPLPHSGKWNAAYSPSKLFQFEFLHFLFGLPINLQYQGLLGPLPGETVAPGHNSGKAPGEKRNILLCSSLKSYFERKNSSSATA